MPRDLAGVREGQYCRQPCLALLCPARGQPQGLHGSPSPPGCILGHSGDRGATVLGGADWTGAGICRSPATARSRRGPCRSGAICLWRRPRTNEFEGTGGSGSPSGSLPARLGEQLFSSCSPRGHREDQSVSAAAPAANETGRSYGSKRINASGRSGSSLILSHKGTPRNQRGSGRSFPWKPVILRLLLQDDSYLLLNHLPRAGSFKSPGWSLPSPQLSDTGGCSSQQRRVLAPSPPQRHLAPIQVVLSGQRCPRVPQQGTRRQWGWHGGTKPCREGTASPSRRQGASLLSCKGHPQGY